MRAKGQTPLRHLPKAEGTVGRWSVRDRVVDAELPLLQSGARHEIAQRGDAQKPEVSETSDSRTGPGKVPASPLRIVLMQPLCRRRTPYRRLFDAHHGWRSRGSTDHKSERDAASLSHPHRKRSQSSCTLRLRRTTVVAEFCRRHRRLCHEGLHAESSSSGQQQVGADVLETVWRWTHRKNDDNGTSSFGRKKEDLLLGFQCERSRAWVAPETAQLELKPFRSMLDQPDA